MKLRHTLLFLATAGFITASYAGLDEGYEAVGRQDFKTAIAEFEPLAEQGNAKAQFALGSMYFNGYGVPQNLERAKKWYTLAAEQGDAVAQMHLGTLLYKQGMHEKALQWFREAAKNGNAKAMTNLGMSYSWGTVVAKDLTESARWYRLAADQGYPDAQYLLGLSYAKGEGVPKSDVDAYAWFSVSAANGFQEAAAERDGVGRMLNPKDLSRGQKLASEYFEKYPFKE